MIAEAVVVGAGVGVGANRSYRGSGSGSRSSDGVRGTTFTLLPFLPLQLPRRIFLRILPHKTYASPQSSCPSRTVPGLQAHHIHLRPGTGLGLVLVVLMVLVVLVLVVLVVLLVLVVVVVAVEQYSRIQTVRSTLAESSARPQ